MIIIYTIIVAFGFVACCLWVKFIFWLFKSEKNIYIEAHKNKYKNDKQYKEYLLWLQKNGGDVPINKIKTIEEHKSDEKIKKLIS